MRDARAYLDRYSLLASRDYCAAANTKGALRRPWLNSTPRQLTKAL